MSQSPNLNQTEEPKQNSLFHFTPETPSQIKNRDNKENRVFLSHLIGLSTVCTGFFLYLLFPLGSERQIRELQSLPPPPPSTSEAIPLKPFMVRLKTAENFRLSRIQVTLHTATSPALKEEIEDSSAAITDQLLLILSDTQSTVFMNPKQLKQLQQDIINHLNLFLVEGEIKSLSLELLTPIK